MTVDDKTLNAIKLIVEWRKMKALCEERTECVGCAYYSRIVCDLLSTDQVLDTTANVFEQYMASIE